MTTLAIIGAGRGIGGAIDPDSDEKSPEALADHLWDLHSRRTEFRRQVAAD